MLRLEFSKSPESIRKLRARRYLYGNQHTGNPLHLVAGHLPFRRAPLAAEGQGAFRRLDSGAPVRPVSKWAVCIVGPATTPWILV